ncbi:MAG TPA: MerR family transcriptional regulator [Magnetospirillum sp.]|jgi:DNA-binding transcriptional MerR regulator|nr:MerR family transcriptional regulator [Magnetospirillum sp.]
MSDDGELPLVRRSGKSESAFRTISEVADDLDVPQHVLRFWESKFPQVKPLKRGGGRRYYRPEDVALLRRIRDLLYSEGYTIKGVQKLLREGGHKEGPAEAKSADEAELPLPMEAGAEQPEFPELHDGEEDDEAAELDALADEGAPVLAHDRFSPETRKELQALLGELEQLRGLLQPR